MWPFAFPLWLILFGGAGFAGVAAALYDIFKDKKTLLTGPIASGKTTFLRHLSDKVQAGASGAPKQYKLKDAVLDEVTDFSGAEEYLIGKFDKYIKEHDYILLFFDVAYFLKDQEYREDVLGRADMINKNISYPSNVVLIGTHIDQVSGNYNKEVELYFASKPFERLLKKIVYVNTTDKECVKKIGDVLMKSI